MAYQNKRELSYIYKIFRPMLKDLLKLNIDFNQNKASDQEIDVFIKWMNENMTDIVSDKDISDFQLILYENFTFSENSDYNNSAEYMRGPDLSDDLKKFKKEEEINIVWTIKASFATLENFPEMPCGKIRNYDKKFEELLDKLHFSKEAKKIYSYNNSPYFRFNALKNPDSFVDSILSLTNFTRDGNINIIRTHYAKDDWLAKYEDFKNLLDLWKKKDKNPKDYNIYAKTYNILIKLIPVITEDGILLTAEQYNEKKLLIQEEILNYCKKNEYVINSPILQGIKEYTQFKEAMEHLLYLVNDDNLEYSIKEPLMLNYADLLNSFIKLTNNKYKLIERALKKCKLRETFKHDPDDLSMQNSSEN